MLKNSIQHLKKPIVIKAFAFFFAFIFFPSLLFAQGGMPAGTPPPAGSMPAGSSVNINITNPVAGGTTIWAFINQIINNIVLPLGGILAVLYIMYAGFMMVTAQGDEKKIGDARKAFFNAAIGTAILLGSWVIANVVANTICSVKGGTMTGSSCSV